MSGNEPDLELADVAAEQAGGVAREVALELARDPRRGGHGCSRSGGSRSTSPRATTRLRSGGGGGGENTRGTSRHPGHVIARCPTTSAHAASSAITLARCAA